MNKITLWQCAQVNLLLLLIPVKANKYFVRLPINNICLKIRHLFAAAAVDVVVVADEFLAMFKHQHKPANGLLSLGIYFKP